MKDVKYSCNLCRCSIKSESGVGVLFTGVGQVAIREVEDANNHLCNECIVMLYDVFRTGTVETMIGRMRDNRTP